MIREEFRLHGTAGGKRRRPRTRRKGLEVETVQVHPLVWEEAMRRADRDVNRIQIVGPDEVLVTNGRERT